ncbi:MAG: hypothetical protein ETSY2_30790 [Candidatus Entotheonella gemina]|uniref:Uncharacterized protein n=1 Tax=Candidatus Entotheonella gemina TaxID=1429439 RepID=W4M1L5_9BACT|nr:MAG: hypothetical protein ETSY2_30790 [Candidatus Entotheonella gemina]
MIEGENIDTLSLWVTFAGLILAILDFTGLKIILERRVDNIIESLRYFIFDNRTGVADRLEMFGKRTLALWKNIASYVWSGAILIVAAPFVLIILLVIGTVASFGLGMPVLAAAYGLFASVYLIMLPRLIETFPYIVYVVLFVITLYVLIWGVMKVAQPIVLFFPWSVLLPVYWFLQGLNMFPGKTLGTIGLAVALVSIH